MFSFRRNRLDPDRQDPGEQAPLLQRAGYLSPDDPAVSPYNLWSIRLLRGFTTLFLAISFVWWIFLLVTLFINPPMVYTHGSGFLGFSYATLTVGYLATALLFFAIPSRPMTIGGIILAIFLLADMCIIIAVPHIRIEEGWVGVASVVWATFISFYGILRNASVAWAKREEEERLTGSAEIQRSTKEWLAVVAQSVVMVILAIVTVLLTATLILRASDASLPPPGEKYDVVGNSYQVHLACVGNSTSSPTVLIEAGELPTEHTLLPFIQNTSVPRYCFWDRPGLAWSDNAPSPYSAGMAADALSEALASANEPGPFVLLAAGIGGIYARVFASRNVPDLHSIFLIDALHEDFLPDIGSSRRGFVLWLRGVVSPLGVDRLLGAIFKGRSREDRVFGISSTQSDRFLKAKLQESLAASSITASDINTARRVLRRDIPLVVVSSGDEVGKSSRWANAQEDLTGITANLKAWDVVDGAPHEVWRSVAGRKVLQERLGEMVGFSI